jgi:transforming growth factor-beta-induced protein
MNTERNLNKRTLSSIAMIIALLSIGFYANEATARTFKKTTIRKLDIVDTAIKASDFNTLVTAVKAADLVDTLKGPGPFTVFAPTDEAFSKLPARTLNNLLKPENKDQLASILTYHVVPGKIMSGDLLKLKGVRTVQSQQASTGLAIDGARVIKTDIKCSNGVIHVIDTVIRPERTTRRAQGQDIVDTAVSANSFSTLVAAVKAAGLVETLKGDGPFTVFAPTDEAFAKLPKATLNSLLLPENKDKLSQILTYHVVPGRLTATDVLRKKVFRSAQGQPLFITNKSENPMINKANIVKTDIRCSNGIIHVIDTVILPPSKNQDIVDTLVSKGPFNTLVAAVKAANLVDTLKGSGTFTVFAPTDEAFAKLPSGTLESLLKPENKKTLTDILTYHVVSGKAMADDVIKTQAAKTVQGQSIQIAPTLDGARVIQMDIPCSNGVIHVIDTVILPK